MAPVSAFDLAGCEATSLKRDGGEETPPQASGKGLAAGGVDEAQEMLFLQLRADRAEAAQRGSKPPRAESLRHLRTATPLHDLIEDQLWQVARVN
jgi:hypothetical protein